VLPGGNAGDFQRRSAGLPAQISKRTLERAKQALGIKARKERGKVDGRWCWEMPSAAAPRTG
jgi:hypothetical protein